MDSEMDANEVFAMAEQIERDAAAFYKQAATLSADAKCRQVLAELGDMESEHEYVLAGMKVELAARPPGPARLGAAGAPGMAALFASGVREDLAHRFTGRETSDEILRRAIEFERDAVVFFLGVKRGLTDAADAQKIDEIIQQELGHILMLMGALPSA